MNARIYPYLFLLPPHYASLFFPDYISGPAFFTAVNVDSWRSAQVPSPQHSAVASSNYASDIVGAGFVPRITPQTSLVQDVKLLVEKLAGSQKGQGQNRIIQNHAP